MRALNILLSILISLALALVVFEGGLQLLGKGAPVTGLEFHPTLGWAKQPSFSYTRKDKEYSIRIKTNELGLRDDPMASAAKPPNTFRVVCLGDSFTLGYVLDREDLFVDQLESWWNSENRRVDVINAGTQAYSTDQEVLWLLENGEAFDPDLVLLFPYENDIVQSGEAKYSRYPKPLFRADGSRETGQLQDPGDKTWLQNRAMVILYNTFFGEKDTSSLFTPEGGKHPILKEFAPVLKQRPAFLADAAARTEGALKALAKECTKLGAELVVVPIPSHSSVDPQYDGVRKVLGLPIDLLALDQPVDMYLGMCRKNGIRTLDVRSTFKAHISNGKELYHTRDWHLNPEGNVALTTFLHDELDSLTLFPEGHQATKAGQISVNSAHHDGGIKKRYIVFGVLWVLLTGLYFANYKDEPIWQPPLKVAGMLAFVFTIIFGGQYVLGKLPPQVAPVIGLLFVVGILGFVAFKLGRRLGTILELFKSFVLRGHWYLIPVVVVLLTIGSLLVVAASSPLIAPFIYTLF